MKDLQALCLQVVPIVQEVGTYIAQQAQRLSQIQIAHKGFNDLVSEVDKQSEQMLIERLTKLLPSAGFLTEEDETQHQLSQAEWHWVVDPLDGTTNFLHGLPIFSISIALLQSQEPVLGVVYEVNREECFYAWKNGGAFCNQQKIQVSVKQQLSESLLATGFPYYDFGRMKNYLDILHQFMQKTHGLRRMGSAAVDLAYTAMGRFEGFFEYNLKPWDVAAGVLLVQEAGGTVSTFGNQQSPIFDKEVLAACAIHPAMLSIIQAHW